MHLKRNSLRNEIVIEKAFFNYTKMQITYCSKGKTAMRKDKLDKKPSKNQNKKPSKNKNLNTIAHEEPYLYIYTNINE